MSGQVPDGLSIGEIADLAGVTPRTVRYYVAEGLLPAPEGTGQQRVYTAEHLLRLQAIKTLKAAYLPLSEIRRRLATMSAAELKQLGDPESPAPRSSALDYLASIQPAAGPRLHETSAVYPRDQSPAVRPARPTASFAPIGQLGSPAPSAAPRVGDTESTTDETVWHRVTLAPGVELHYQLSGDRRRDTIIAHIIRTAAHLLGSPPRKQNGD